VEKADLVEPTGTTSSHTGGRPAAYFRFRRSITLERPAPGLRIGSRGWTLTGNVLAGWTAIWNFGSR